MARKFYDLAAKGGEYTNRDGDKKHRFIPAGKLCVEDDGRMWVALEWPGVNLMLSVFEQKPRDVSRDDTPPPRGGGGGPGRAPDLDDDIPFAMEWR